MEVPLVKAVLSDYPLVRDMSQSYLEALSLHLPWIATGGLLETPDKSGFFRSFFEDAGKQAFLIRHGAETAGFALIKKSCVMPDTDWSISELFVSPAFQKKSLGRDAAHALFRMYPARWETDVVPANPAVSFWRKVFAEYTQGRFREDIRDVTVGSHKDPRVVFSFI